MPELLHEPSSSVAVGPLVLRHPLQHAIVRTHGLLEDALLGDCKLATAVVA